eukprot:COSAG04_NODE_19385_length_417_cov_1.276730_2_plen_73_part_00
MVEETATGFSAAQRTYVTFPKYEQPVLHPCSAPDWSTNRRAVPTPRQRPGSQGGSWGSGGMGTAEARSGFYM